MTAPGTILSRTLAAFAPSSLYSMMRNW
jgi:hypothetical protein